MLNEFKQLSDAILSSSITTFSWHPNWSVGGRPAFVLGVNSKGRVESAELVSDENEVSLIRKFSESNTGGSFPGFKVPLLYSDSESQIKLSDFKETHADTDKLFEALKKLPSDWAEKKVGVSFRHSLEKMPVALLGRVGNIPDSFKALRALTDRVKLITTKTLYEDILKCSRDQIRKNVTTRKEWFRSLLCASGSRENQSAYVVFEVSDPEKFVYPVQCEKTREFINSRLLDFDKKNGESSGRDYYGGKLLAKDRELVFPMVNIPVLARFTLFSKNEDAASNERYGLNGPRAFLVGSENRQKIKDAIEWITDRSRENKTWKDVSGSFGYNGKKPIRTMLLAYPSKLPETTSDIAALLGGTCDPELSFEACSKIVLQWLEKLIPDEPNAEVNILCLSKPDNYNTRLVFNETVTAKRLLENIKDWTLGCQNIPSMRFFTHSKLGVITPEIPSPSDVAKVVNYCWCRNGSHADYVYGIKLGEILRMFLDDKNAYSKNIERGLLNLLMKNAVSLLSEVASCSTANRSYSCEKDSSNIIVSSLKFLPSILGLVLHRLSLSKEQYMESSEFLLGKLFGLSDLLHVEYATRDSGTESGRKKKVPEALIGNESYRQALLNPSRALSRWADRMAVYVAWARSSGSARARWALREIGLITGKLGPKDLPSNVTDTAKAQLVFGYLYRKEKEVEQEADGQKVESVSGVSDQPQVPETHKMKKEYIKEKTTKQKA